MKRILLIGCLVCGAIGLTRAQDVASVRRQYAEVRQTIALAKQEAHLRNQATVTLRHNVPGIGAQTLTYQLYLTPCELDGAGGQRPRRLRFAECSYNIAARSFYEEFLYDAQGLPVFVYVRTPDERGESIDRRFYFAHGSLIHARITRGAKGSVEVIHEGDQSSAAFPVQACYEKAVAVERLARATVQNVEEVYAIETDVAATAGEFAGQEVDARTVSRKVEALQITDESGVCSPKKGLFRAYDSRFLGISAEVKSGGVVLRFDREKVGAFTNPEVVGARLTEPEYRVKGLRGQCVGLFIADIGQNINPVLCLLLEDGSVQAVSLFESILSNRGFSGFVCSDRLPQMADIVAFEFGGGGAYENQGQTMFEYVTIYAIDEKGKKWEIEIE